MTDRKRTPDQDQGSQKSEPREEQTRQTPSPGSVGLLARMTTLAWNLVIPIVGGVLLGHYLDQRSGNGLTWTLSLLVLGVMIAFSNLYNLYMEHGREHIEDKKDKHEKQESHEKE